MTVLLAHNYYQQSGGEDRSYEAEAALLEARGHRVVRFTMHNDQIRTMPAHVAARKTLWNADAYERLQTLIQHERPQIAHFNNTFPLISPAAYYAAAAYRLPVVQTLRNYRLSCVNGYFFRDGHVCEDCLGRRVPWPGVVHGCYRSSRAASGTVAAMLALHRAWRTWTQQVDCYVALTRFAREKFIAAGLPPGKIVVKSNFLASPPQPGAGDGGYALFVGRLSPEKGLRTLIAAWSQLPRPFPLKIVGDGPLASVVQTAAAEAPNIEWLGWQAATDVQALMKEARMLILPSEWYETFGRVGMEALAAGTPVIASDLGAVAELVEPGATGLLVRPGDPGDLAAAVAWALDHPAEWAQMRRAARARFEARYTADRNYQQLMALYDRAAKHAQVRYGQSSPENRSFVSPSPAQRPSSAAAL